MADWKHMVYRLEYYCAARQIAGADDIWSVDGGRGRQCEYCCKSIHMFRSISLTVGPAQLTLPTMADLFREEDRGKSMAIAALLPYAGPAVGPIVGGLVLQLLSWEWIFWVISIAATVVTIAGFIFFEETYTPVLLRRKQAAQASTPSNKHGSTLEIRRSLQSAHTHINLIENLMRPIRFYWTRPVILLIAGLLALDMGVYCLMLSSLAALWMDKYHLSEFHSSLHYIAVAIGATVNGQFGSYLMDRIYASLARRNMGLGRPEFRIPYLIPGLFLMPAGLVWYGWSAQHEVSWVMVDVGIVIFTLGSFTTAQAVNAYLLDEFSEHGASAMAASCLLQNVIGFVLPIFAPQMYKALGYGWGNSLVALALISAGFPMATVLWFRGERIRAVGREEEQSSDEVARRA